MLLLGAALTALVLPLVEGRSHHWPLWTWLCLGSVPVLLSAFVRYEMRRVAPLIDMGLFKIWTFNAGLGVQLLFWIGQGAFFITFALYCQLGLGLTPLASGCLFLTVGAGFMASSTAARHVVTRLGVGTLTLGALVMGSGLTLVLAVGGHARVGHVAPLIAPLVVVGVGMGFVLGPLTGVTMSAVGHEHAGAAAGVFSTGVQIGTAIGVAVIGVVFFNAVGDGSVPDDYRHAFATGLPYLMGLFGVITACTATLRRPGRGDNG